MQNNINNPQDNLSIQNIEKMYPELYNKIKPYVEDIASQLRNQNIDENMIDSIVQDILRRSGLSQNPGSTCTQDGTCPADYMYGADERDGAIAVQRNMNYGNNMYGNNMYGRYPRRQYPNYQRRRRYPFYPTYPVYPIYPIYPRSPADIVRILLLQQLGGYYNYY